MTNEETAVNSAGNTGTGVQPSATPLIDAANSAAQRMEAANQEAAKLLARQEAIIARSALGGRADAGTAVNDPQQEIDAQAAALLAPYFPKK